MSFNATSVTLENGLRLIREVAAQEKNYLGVWAGLLNGTVTAEQVLNMGTNIDRAIQMMDANATLPGMAAYAQVQLGGGAYDIVAEYNTMRAALDAIRVWIRGALPSTAISVSNGTIVYASYATAATAPLRSLVVAAAATIG